MSLITRCPACTTLFKVVPDQLRVSEGWVRCGQCDEVFDANAHLQGEAQAVLLEPLTTAEDSGMDTEPQMPVDPGPQLEQELAAKMEWPETPSTNYDAVMDVRPGAVFHLEPALHLEMPEEVVEPQTVPFEAPPLAVVAEPPWEDVPAQAQAQAQAAEEPFAAVEPTEVYIPPSAASPPESPTVASAPIPLSGHAPAFMRKASKDSTANRPWVQRSLASVSVLLVVGLGLQVTRHERDRLAASVPDLRPSLAAMCEALKCQIAPFKQIDAVVIDASSFVKVRGDVYRLNLTLKNTAPMDVAAPALELTLTDTQDQPMIRHVLSATELGAQRGTLAAGGELTTVVPLNVKTAGNAERISGYRLLAFYP